MLATYLLTLSGTAIIYQGQEIGQVNMPKDWSIEEEYQDLASINWLKDVAVEAKAKNDPSLLEAARKGLQLTARDHARVPMNWSNSKNGGFSTADKCWMRAHSYEKINVEDQLKDKTSALAYYQRLLKFRKENKDLFALGIFELVDATNEKTFTYIKHSRDGKKQAFVALNFSDEKQPLEFPSQLKSKPTLVFGSIDGADGPLAPYEARIYFA